MTLKLRLLYFPEKCFVSRASSLLSVENTSANLLLVEFLARLQTGKVFSVRPECFAPQMCRGHHDPSRAAMFISLILPKSPPSSSSLSSLLLLLSRRSASLNSPPSSWLKVKVELFDCFCSRETHEKNTARYFISNSGGLKENAFYRPGFWLSIRGADHMEARDGHLKNLLLIGWKRKKKGEGLRMAVTAELLAAGGQSLTQPVEGVVTLHVLRRRGEGGAAGVLVHLPRGHDRELACNDNSDHSGRWFQPSGRFWHRGDLPTTPGP